MQIAILHEDQTIFVSMKPSEYEEKLSKLLKISKKKIHEANLQIIEELKKKTLTA